MSKELFPRLGQLGRPDHEWEVYKQDNGWEVWHPNHCEFDGEVFASQQEAIQALVLRNFLP